jgi:hypothetical protein
MMTDRGHGIGGAGIFAPLSARTMPAARAYSGSGRELAEAAKFRAQRQQAAARRQRAAAAAAKGARRDGR